MLKPPGLYCKQVGLSISFRKLRMQAERQFNWNPSSPSNTCKSEIITPIYNVPSTFLSSWQPGERRRMLCRHSPHRWVLTTWLLSSLKSSFWVIPSSYIPSWRRRWCKFNWLFLWLLLGIIHHFNCQDKEFRKAKALSLEIPLTLLINGYLRTVCFW